MRTHSLCLTILCGAASLAAACTAGTPTIPFDDAEVSYQTALARYDTCTALETDLKDMLLAELETDFERYQGGIGIPEEDAVAAPPAEGGREAGTDFSGTNNQEAGVDEADFVKTDGYHIYTLNGNRLHIFDVPEFGQLVPASEIEIEGWPSQLLLDSDAGKAVVFSSVPVPSLPEDHPVRDLVGREEIDVKGEQWVMWRVYSLAKVTVLDISDPAAPAIERELYLESDYQTARMIDGSVRMSAYSWMNAPGLYDWWYYGSDAPSTPEEAKARARQRILDTSLDDLVPQIYERRADGSVIAHALTQDACASFYRPANSHGRGFTSLLTLDLFASSLHYDADHIVSNWSTIYASEDFLYIAEPANDWWWFWWNDDHPEQLNLHMFDVRSAGETRYLGSGRVEGTLLNQFSMDEHEGYLRVATTTNRWRRWWQEEPPPSENHIYVLDLGQRELEVVGHLDGIAEGESIFAARMMGERGYLVTFEQIDPLFTLDLSDPTDPRVIGELEVFGVSTYIHPLADDKLLTIGMGGDENGLDWRAQVSLFDVGDFASPALVDTEALVQSGWGWSEALYEHKAFQYWAPKSLLAVPMSSSGYDEQSGFWTYTSKLELVTVDLASGLSRYGTVDHSGFFPEDGGGCGWWLDIRRSIFMGDYIYAISDHGITAHHLDDLSTPAASVALPGYGGYAGCAWAE